MRKLKLIIPIIFLLLVIPTLINFMNIKDDSDTISSLDENQFASEINSKKPKTAASQTYNELWIDDSGISGNGTWSYINQTYSWCTWTGSEYKIEDITLSNLDNTGSTLIIANSTVNFIIQNCSISNSGSGSNYAGISLLNASNGKIFDCKIFNNNYGIRLANIGGDGSKNNIIKNNTINSNSGIALFFESGSDGNDIINNTITNHNSYDIYVYSSDASLIENNTIEGGSSGILLQYADNVVARNNTIIGCTTSGIAIYDALNLELSGNTMQDCGIVSIGNTETDLRSSTIYNNNTANGKAVYFYKDEIGLDSKNFTSSGQPGQILLLNCSYSDIADFTLSDASVGIELCWSENNTISNITANNGYRGIYLHYYCQNNTIFNNTVNDNSYGIHLYHSDDNNVTNNIANYDTNGVYLENSHDNNLYNNEIDTCTQHGLSLRASERNNIEKNQISNNGYSGAGFDGINLNSAHFNNVTDNTITNNQRYGINVYRTNNCSITKNRIRDHPDVGIFLDGDDGGSNNNTIYLNYFINNNEHAIDNVLNGDNKWDNGTIGNYWDTYTGSDPDGDGIGNTPYLIPGLGNNYDTKPIVLAGSGGIPGTLAAGDDDDDDDDEDEDDPDFVILVIVVIVIASIGAGVAVGIILIKKGIIVTSRSH